MSRAGTSEPRAFVVGDSLGSIGALVVSDAATVSGLHVRVSGSALDRGLVSFDRASARPWSARLAPWQRSTWEHSLAPREGALSCVLRAATAGPSLSRAAWISLHGAALRAGDGSLTLSVRGDGDAHEVSFAVSVSEALDSLRLSRVYESWREACDAMRAVLVRAAPERELLTAQASGARRSLPVAHLRREGKRLHSNDRWLAQWRAARRASLSSLQVERASHRAEPFSLTLRQEPGEPSVALDLWLPASAADLVGAIVAPQVPPRQFSRASAAGECAVID